MLTNLYVLEFELKLAFFSNYKKQSEFLKV